MRRRRSKIRLGAPLVFAVALVAACGSNKSSGFGDSSGDAGLLGGGDASAFGDGGVGVGPILDGGCATATADAQRAPVYMLFVLDGSSSMSDDNKWNAVVPALQAIFDDLAAKADPSVGVGLVGFSDWNDPTCQTFNTPFGVIKGACAGPYPSSVDVPIALVDAAQRAKLATRLSGSKPSGDTPTHAALVGGYASLEAFTPAAPLLTNGKKVLVLMTDGVPTDSKTAEDTSLAADALSKAAPAGPVTTFAVGIGPFPSSNTQGYDPAFMGALAQAGGAAPPGCNPSENSNVANVCHFQVTPGGKTAAQLTQDFVDAINKIRSAAATCDFVLQKSSSPVDPGQVNVIYTDGAGVQHVLVQDPQNGWTYDNPSDPTRVILHGADCDTVKNDGLAKVSIVLGCKTVTK